MRRGEGTGKLPARTRVGQGHLKPAEARTEGHARSRHALDLSRTPSQSLLAPAAIVTGAALHKALPTLPDDSPEGHHESWGPPAIPLPPLPDSPITPRTLVRSRSSQLAGAADADSRTTPLEDGYESASSIELDDILSTPLPRRRAKRRISMVEGAASGEGSTDDSSDSDVDVQEVIEDLVEGDLPDRDGASSPELVRAASKRDSLLVSSPSFSRMSTSTLPSRTPERQIAQYSSSDEEDFDLSLDNASSVALSRIQGNSSGASRLSLVSAASSRSSTPSESWSPRIMSESYGRQRHSDGSGSLSPRFLLPPSPRSSRSGFGGSLSPTPKRHSHLPKPRQLEGPIVLKRSSDASLRTGLPRPLSHIASSERLSPTSPASLAGSSRLTPPNAARLPKSARPDPTPLGLSNSMRLSASWTSPARPSKAASTPSTPANKPRASSGLPTPKRTAPSRLPAPTV